MAEKTTTAKRERKERARRQVARRSNSLVSADGLLVRAFKRTLPSGYVYGGGASVGQNWHSVVVSVPHPFTDMLRATGRTARAAYAAVLRLARGHAEGVALALDQCTALGLEPYAYGPYPFGPMNHNAVSHMGGGMMAPGLVETRQNVVWLLPHAITALVAARWVRPE